MSYAQATHHELGAIRISVWPDNLGGVAMHSVHISHVGEAVSSYLPTSAAVGAISVRRGYARIIMPEHPNRCTNILVGAVRALTYLAATGMTAEGPVETVGLNVSHRRREGLGPEMLDAGYTPTADYFAGDYRAEPTVPASQILAEHAAIFDPSFTLAAQPAVVGQAA